MYPEEMANSSGTAPGQSEGRYQAANLSAVKYAYPVNSDSGFNVPTIRFGFLNAYAENIINSPKVYIRMPNSFGVTSTSDYSRTENIFGAGSGVGGISALTDFFKNVMQGKITDAVGITTEQVDAVGKAGISGAEALQYSLKKGAGNILGFVGSAGLSNINQYEFTSRKAVNPMAQLLYKGPQFRRYQLPFPMKPRNVSESEHIQKIINVFRVASSPSVPDTTGILGDIGAGSSFTFGYPHLTQFVIMFDTPGAGPKTIYKSKVCVIEAVTVDYGTQKLTFFEGGYPTEINLTLSMTEITPRTLGDAKTDSLNSSITLG
jgi:hypothetical protein